MSKKSNESIGSIRAKNFLKSNAIFLGIFLLLIIIGAFMILNSKASEESFVFGDDVIELHFFHLSTCPHCHAQIAFHPTILAQYPNVKILEYEIKSTETQTKYKEFAAKIGGADPTRIATPTTFIGNRSNVGFGSPESTGQVLLEMIAEEQARIDAQWDENTMIRTVDLREQLQE